MLNGWLYVLEPVFATWRRPDSSTRVSFHGRCQRTTATAVPLFVQSLGVDRENTANFPAQTIMLY